MGGVVMVSLMLVLVGSGWEKGLLFELCLDMLVKYRDAYLVEAGGV
jgi:hypothetical protein